LQHYLEAPCFVSVEFCSIYIAIQLSINKYSASSQKLKVLWGLEWLFDYFLQH
jgi:hypothetical protein